MFVCSCLLNCMRFALVASLVVRESGKHGGRVSSYQYNAQHNDLELLGKSDVPREKHQRT
jgi:hypothetical protein